MEPKTVIDRINIIIAQGENAIKGSELGFPDYKYWAGFRSSALSLIKNLFGEKHIYYKDFDKYTDTAHIPKIKSGISILCSIVTEIELGWFKTYKEIISAEVFSDFLEMSKYLLDQKFKDPAAVMIGSVLEEHLRFLCEKKSIEIFIRSGDNEKPKKADTLNSELHKAEVYGLLDHKNITAWLDLRNKAAHGKYNEYTIEHVSIMYAGVQHFLTIIK